MRWPSTGAWCQGTQDAGFRSQEPGLLCLSCALEYPGKSTMCVCVGVCVCEGASGERTQDIDTAATASNNLQLVQTIAAKSNEAGLTKKLRKEGGPIDLLAAEGT